MHLGLSTPLSSPIAIMPLASQCNDGRDSSTEFYQYTLHKGTRIDGEKIIEMQKS